jgi:hypothetical protein
MAKRRRRGNDGEATTAAIILTFCRSVVLCHAAARGRSHIVMNESADALFTDATSGTG